MKAEDFFKTEMDAALKGAKAITAKADEEARSLTEPERAEVKELLDKATHYKSRITEAEENEELKKSIDRLSVQMSQPEAKVEPDSPRDFAEAFVKSSQYRALKERGFQGRWATGPVEITRGMKVDSNTGFVAFSEGNNDDARFPQVLPGIQTPVEQRLTVADLLATGTATSNSIKFVRETNTDNAAASTGEGQTKPPSNLELEVDGADLVKITTMLTVTEEMFADVDQMEAYIRGRLALFVRQEEERQLLLGTGGTDLTGLVPTGQANATDESAIGGDNLFDGILAGITSVRVDGGLEPDGVIIHPTDFARMSVLKAGTTGNYFSGGPYAGPAQNPWGLRSVVTTAQPEGSVLVGAFRQGAQVWRKGGLTVDATNSHDDYFARNLIALRAEERLALTIYRPQAFVLVGITS